MMEVLRTRNPEIFKFIADKLIMEGEVSRVSLVEHYVGIMIRYPDDINVTVVLENDELKGFIIGQLLKNKTYVIISQAWAAHDMPTGGSLEAIKHIEEWTLAEGYKKIRMESTLNARALRRKYGFRLYCHKYEKEL